MIFLKTNKSKVLLILVTVVLVVVMAISTVGKERAGIVSNTFGIVLSPFQKIVTYVSDCLSYGSDRMKYADENKILKQQLVTAQKRTADYEELEKENIKLKSMLELQKTSQDHTFVAADVIASNATNWSSTVRISKGLSSGIKKNDTVLTEAGLVGYVSDVGRNWADVTTIVDTTSSVSAIIERVDEYCMLQGDISLYDDNLCMMKYASVDTSVSEGDILTTSGEGGIFDSGIQIGKITDIKVNKNGISQDAIIEPFVDFDNLDTVLVITN
ncbi:MAG: rod shape-determining protein MreC [Clostridia bacterium]|nr:rod shape-determining protein MreC [Clostridia bacterium]